ncbi:MAG: WYL domain-containing protein [Rhodococcus sp. (in: high G+C Gram-positive bacteria)]|uniref:helix-turn-helix transcriptional regulator n=1 Tax=Rhodococcus sp. TaxID=1831 RepID=UPI003BB7278B
MAGSASRMLSLLSLLQARRSWPGHVLAQRLGVTPRTVRRDVGRLRELGYEVGATMGPDGGYRLASGSEFLPLMFDDDQAIAIAVALQNAPSSGIDLDEAATRALATVRQVMPSRLRHRIDAVRFTGSESASQVGPAVLEAVCAAVRDQRILRCDYGDTDFRRPPRRVEPHAVVARKGRWYLIAWDQDRDDRRLLRLDRLTPRTPGGPRFTPRPLPAPDARTFLAARAKGSVAEDRWLCTGEVVIDLPASEVAPWISDGEVEEVTERSCRIVVGSWSWAGLLALVLRFDAPFVVVGPEPLRVTAGLLAARLDVASATRDRTDRNRDSWEDARHE